MYLTERVQKIFADIKLNIADKLTLNRKDCSLIRNDSILP